MQQQSPKMDNERLSFNERLAVKLTAAAGSMWMAYGLVAFYLVWIFVNTFLGRHAPDPYPFPFLLFISNALQLWWLPVISVGQYVMVRQNLVRQHENDQMMRNQSHMMEAMVDMMRQQQITTHADLEEDRQASRYLLELLKERDKWHENSSD